MQLDLDETDPRWAPLALEALTQRACAVICDHLQLDAESASLSLLACDDARIAELNTEFRGKPSPTNVLSWPAVELIPPALPEPDFDGELALGDIALAYETCAREAAEQGKTPSDHITHLIVHGVLHLLGYDHERDIDATLMEGLETEILGKMGIKDPYS